jgi:hypothetical protein
LGGAAEGMMNAQKMGLAERELDQNTALRSRGLDLQGRQLEHNISQDVLKQADAQIAATLEQAGAIIKAGIEGGADPAAIRKSVLPLIESVAPIAQRVGRDPNALTAQIDAQLAAPTPVARAGVKGRAAGTERIEQARTEQQQPEGARVEISPFKEEKDRIEAEHKLRDDFTKASEKFVITRDFFDRMQSATASGAGDITRVYSFMKMQDPGSAVLPGEYATAANAPGVPEAVRSMYNKLVGGGILSPGARGEIEKEAKQIWASSLNQHANRVGEYTRLAKGAGLRPKQIIVDLTAGSEGPTRGTTATGINWNLR